MYKYIILPNPGHNRIYFNSALKIAQLELKALFYNDNLLHIEEVKIGSNIALSFCSEHRLSETQLMNVGKLSLYYVIFEHIENDLMKLIDIKEFRKFPDSFNQILRYNGKTNEQFTRLMLNVAKSACKTNSKTMKLLDPMCGKATTLIEGLIQGLDVVGVEISEKVTKEVQTFVVRYLKEGRYKHNTKIEKIMKNGGKKIAECFEVNTASNKEEYNNGNVQNFKLYTADTTMVEYLIKKNSCDILVSDLPYGVQHGTKLNSNSKTSRGPSELLDQCCNGWYMVMKKGGAVVLAYNEFTIKYDKIAVILEQAGFMVLRDEPYIDYLHRVDQAIKRNIIVARKE